MKTIDEAIEILTRVRAGSRKEDGTFEKGTVGERAHKRLKELAQTLVRFGKDEGEKEREKDGISRAFQDADWPRGF
jgi:hypothetical protein